jgi:hypothetical protein
MKTMTKIALLGLATTFFATAGAFATDSDSTCPTCKHHAAASQSSRTRGNPVAVSGHSRVFANGMSEIKSDEPVHHLLRIPWSTGNITYFGPAD